MKTTLITILVVLCNIDLFGQIYDIIELNDAYAKVVTENRTRKWHEDPWVEIKSDGVYFDKKKVNMVDKVQRLPDSLGFWELYEELLQHCKIMAEQKRLFHVFGAKTENCGYRYQMDDTDKDNELVDIVGAANVVYNGFENSVGRYYKDGKAKHRESQHSPKVKYIVIAEYKGYVTVNYIFLSYGE
jgi:hypothetical protein